MTWGMPQPGGDNAAWSAGPPRAGLSGTGQGGLLGLGFFVGFICFRFSLCSFSQIVA